jgi:hypothetical protein
MPVLILVHLRPPATAVHHLATAHANITPATCPASCDAFNHSLTVASQLLAFAFPCRHPFTLCYP